MRAGAGAGDTVADLPFHVEILNTLDTAAGAGHSVQSVPQKSVIHKVSRRVPAVPREAEKAAGTRALTTTTALLPSAQSQIKKTNQKGC